LSASQCCSQGCACNSSRLSNSEPIGIKVPDYSIVETNQSKSIGRFTRLITQYYDYENKSTGQSTQECREYLQVLKGAATIIPFCPKEDKFMLIRQFRYPAWYNSQRPVSGLPVESSTPEEDGWLYETIAGVIEKDEDPISTVVREVEEEGELRVDPRNVRLVHRCFMTPGLTNEEMFIYAAYVPEITNVNTSGYTSQREHLYAKWMSPNEIRSLHAQGLIRDAKTLIALYAVRVL
jgi:ADP-ribose pyrophosphatase